MSTVNVQLWIEGLAGPVQLEVTRETGEAALELWRSGFDGLLELVTPLNANGVTSEVSVRASRVVTMALSRQTGIMPASEAVN